MGNLKREGLALGEQGSGARSPAPPGATERFRGGVAARELGRGGRCTELRGFLESDGRPEWEVSRRGSKTWSKALEETGPGERQRGRP